MSLFRRLYARSRQFLSKRALRGDSQNLRLPTQSRVVVCGGGVIGSSVAYHLAQRGWTDVVLLEQGRSLGCGTTWHAAGLVGMLRSTKALMTLSKYGRELYKSLETKTGFDTGFRECGALYLATTEDSMAYFKRLLSLAKSSRIEAHLVTPKEANQLCYDHWIRTDDLKGALWVPQGGTANPSDVCQALAKGASQKGVTIITSAAVNSILTSNGRVWGVETDEGNIRCEYFVNCGGQWAHQLGKKSNPQVAIPLHSTEHFYVVTQPIKGIPNMLPVMREYDAGVYLREWSGGVCAGVFEVEAKPCFADGIPDNFEFQLLPEDWEHIAGPLEAAIHRMPALGKAEIRQQINGPESFTPDNRCIMGEAPEIENYFVAAGLNSSGIANAAGVGRCLVEWIIDGRPSVDLTSMDIKRFAEHHNEKSFLYNRVKEVVGWNYALPYPGKQFNESRGVKWSPLAERHGHAGAVWGEVMGNEIVQWFGDGKHDNDQNTFGRPRWLEFVRAELLAAWQSSALFDLTSFAKFEIRGRGALHLVEKLCCVKTNMPNYSQQHAIMLNEKGGIEVDCQLVRLEENRHTYFLLTAAELLTRAHHWIRRHLPEDQSVTVFDRTDDYALLSLIGPKTDTILSRAFHLSTLQRGEAKEADFVLGDFSPVILTKDKTQATSILVPAKFAIDVYDQLMKSNRNELINAGMHAYNAWRVQNGLATWQRELSPYISPLEAGMTDLIDYTKYFIGKEALLSQREDGIKRTLALFRLEDPTGEVMPWGNEPIRKRGGEEIVGVTTSGATFDVDSEAALCLGYVNLADWHNLATDKAIRDHLVEMENDYVIDVSGKAYRAKIVYQKVLT